MKIPTPYAPKTKLTELLRRRQQTLASWVAEMGIASSLAFELYCVRHKLEMPDLDDVMFVFMKPASTSVPVPAAPPPVENAKEAEPVATDEEPSVELRLRQKKVRNALVKVSPSVTQESPSKTPENAGANG